MTPRPPAGATAAVGADARRSYRRFLLDHHPDLGGDREVFERGLTAHRAALSAAGGGVGVGAVVAHRSPGARRTLRRWWMRRRRSRR